ncbi:hypothetical protein CF335_g8884 [Tilletia laevis]|nr:hypothetical protein CF335_g8884 [Tilletia laevis]
MSTISSNNSLPFNKASFFTTLRVHHFKLDAFAWVKQCISTSNEATHRVWDPTKIGGGVGVTTVRGGTEALKHYQTNFCNTGDADYDLAQAMINFMQHCQSQWSSEYLIEFQITTGTKTRRLNWLLLDAPVPASDELSSEEEDASPSPCWDSDSECASTICTEEGDDRDDDATSIFPGRLAFSDVKVISQSKLIQTVKAAKPSGIPRLVAGGARMASVATRASAIKTFGRPSRIPIPTSSRR